MSDRTGIEWTDATWQPITGCALVSPGCTNCYAMKLAGTRLRNLPSRVGLTRPSKAGPVWTGEVRLNEKWLTQPLTWRRPRKIFVCAHGDLFAEGVPDAWIDRVFAVMALAQQHTFQVLTKRSARMRAYLTALPERMRSLDCDSGLDFHSFPLPNVWLGVSAEDQRRADERVPDLMMTPAAVRFVSAEPLLGPIDFTRLDLGIKRTHGYGDRRIEWDALSGWERQYPADSVRGDGRRSLCSGSGPHRRIHQVIDGGESGRSPRPMHPDWPRQIRDACDANGTAYFHKQNGVWRAVCEGPADWYASLYRSKVTARAGESQEALDDLYGRRCAVPQIVLTRDGTVFEDVAAPGAYQAGSGSMLMFCVGKKAAGRLLDGVEHNGMPEVRAA